MSNAFRATRDTGGIKPTRYYSDKQEKHIAKATGGKQTANSGATEWQKGDVQSKYWLYEAKTKVKDSETMTVHESWFTKNLDESFREGKPYNAVVINFGPDKPNYYCIDESTFMEFLEFQKRYGCRPWEEE